ncbi:MAG: FAD-dependent oxidoreductase [Gemmatimonadaceae bacterium]|nr:FAD-dependent oxidoreductase [Gemmatimonadaceae bacterium]NUP70992.1 FAD-dependent oxidoreductase [Gemmatimonadaceae bacterium]NUR33622.1 FAD-dependent oxidoreductase [Gemmatimonadaceae bacterium]NUS31554.1 FAD-dependent oxidoreductase [Gemmatimonadaceae bacterium]NUS47878.1 FAD-dependent oxidoreductase [Gemmatimonadaceae bacterium]
MCAALYTGRSMLRTAVLERGIPGGELLNTEKLDDWIGEKSILGWELAKKFEDHSREFGAEYVTATVTAVTRRLDGTFDTVTDVGDVYRSLAVIVTAGGTPVKLGIPGEAEYAGRGVSYCAICDGAFFKQQVIAVVGGGDAAVEEADFLTRYASKVYVIHRRDEFRASKILQERLFANPKVEVIWNTVAERILGDEQGLMKGIELRDVQSDATRTLDATGCFVFVGFRPNTGIIDGHFDHDEMGYVLTDSMMQTSIPGLFAAGDLRSQLTRQVTTAVGDATTAAIAVEKYLKARAEGGHAVDPHGSGGYAV